MDIERYISVYGMQYVNITTTFVLSKKAMVTSL